MDLYSNWEIEDEDVWNEDVWNEDEWEEFMQEADRRAEEYMKKFEEEYQKLQERKKDPLYPENVY